MVRKTYGLNKAKTMNNAMLDSRWSSKPYRQKVSRLERRRNNATLHQLVNDANANIETYLSMSDLDRWAEPCHDLHSQECDINFYYEAYNDYALADDITGIYHADKHDVYHLYNRGESYNGGFRWAAKKFMNGDSFQKIMPQEVIGHPFYGEYRTINNTVYMICETLANESDWYKPYDLCVNDFIEKSRRLLSPYVSKSWYARVFIYYINVLPSLLEFPNKVASLERLLKNISDNNARLFSEAVPGLIKSVNSFVPFSVDQNRFIIIGEHPNVRIVDRHVLTLGREMDMVSAWVSEPRVADVLKGLQITKNVKSVVNKKLSEIGYSKVEPQMIDTGISRLMDASIASFYRNVRGNRFVVRRMSPDAFHKTLLSLRNVPTI